MHEFSIAMNIVDIAIAEAKKAQAEKISEIEIEIGRASGVVREALEFALESVVKGTALENAIIIIYEIPAIAECNSCKHTFKIESNIGECPECGDITANLVSGRELKVKTITID
jgi:hydrogenase nickel incorporation protein HypA/HybF